jgi:hypothetical protein
VESTSVAITASLLNTNPWLGPLFSLFLFMDIPFLSFAYYFCITFAWWPFEAGQVLFLNGGAMICKTKTGQLLVPADIHS